MEPKRDSDLKWNGWGYKDSFFFVNDRGIMEFSGSKYEMSGRTFPELVKWMKANLDMDISYKAFSEKQVDPTKIPKPILNKAFIDWLESQKVSFTTDDQKRVHRSHGHTLEDLVKLRIGECAERIPDVVVFPTSHDQVVEIVKAANQFNVVIIPIGGGTSVSSALKCPENEERCIVSLDMCSMSRVLWIDQKNMTAQAQSGIIGIDLENQLNEKGFTLGHEPDSVEFSSLGGWVATRASGIKKNKYGNIEDILVHVKCVTPNGVIEKSCVAPRISCGPDIHHLIIGSEGTLGVITEVTFKICRLPQCKRFGSILFPTFENGVMALREMANQKLAPASVRLMDNDQFRFGQALKPISSLMTKMGDFVKRLYVTQWKKFNPNEMAPATLVFEGTKEEVDLQEKRTYEIASKFGGFPAGEENGRSGYLLTFAIAYLRDIGLDYMAVGESFETSVPWNSVVPLCRNVKELCKRECKRHGVKHPPLVSCRVTQLYDAGACVYFYLGFNYRDLEVPNSAGDEKLLIEKALHVYEEIETAARNEIINCGGSISHHHGVGKIRKQWLPRTVGQVGLSTLNAIKQHLDPKNIFANGNLFTVVSKL